MNHIEYNTLAKLARLARFVGLVKLSDKAYDRMGDIEVSWDNAEQVQYDRDAYGI